MAYLDGVIPSECVKFQAPLYHFDTYLKTLEYLDDSKLFFEHIIFIQHLKKRPIQRLIHSLISKCNKQPDEQGALKLLHAFMTPTHHTLPGTSMPKTLQHKYHGLQISQISMLGKTSFPEHPLDCNEFVNIALIDPLNTTKEEKIIVNVITTAWLKQYVVCNKVFSAHNLIVLETFDLSSIQRIIETVLLGHQTPSAPLTAAVEHSAFQPPPQH